MPIKCVEFGSGGFPFNPSEDIEDQITAALSDVKNYTEKTFEPGIYDLTPKEWEDPNFRYWLKVENDGTGRILMIPFVEGARSKFVENREWQAGYREFWLRPDSEKVVIAGGSRESSTGLALYKLIFYVESSGSV